MSERVSITVPKLPQLQRLLRGNDLFREPWREAIDAIGALNEQVAISRAPLGPTGSTIARMTHKTDRREVPMYTVVKTTARNPRNRYVYPRLIEYSPRSPRRGWFRAAFNSAKSSWPAILDRAASKISDIWSRSL